MARLSERLDEVAQYLFKPTSRGKLAMLVYPPEVERRLTPQLPQFVDRLTQSGLRVAVVDVNHQVNQAIKSRMDDIIAAWREDRDAAKHAVYMLASENVNAATQVADKVADVVVWSRVGGAFPFLRVAPLMEKHIGRLGASLLVFFPGSLEGKTTLRLLDERDGYQYRADYLRTVDE